MGGVDSSFWWLRQARPGAVAVIDELGRRFTYGDLSTRADAAAEEFARFGARRLGFLLFGNRLGAISAYLGCLRAGHVPLLLPETISREALSRLKQRYRPDWILRQPQSNDERTHAGTDLAVETFRYPAADPELHDNLGLLLSTSGSTGSSRLVRLAYSALEANANAIAGYLGIAEGERAATTMPPSYSFGLSVINSHLAGGAILVLSQRGLMEGDFWRAMREQDVTSLAGVPYSYQMMHRLRLDRIDLPALRTLTQAGGRLGKEFVTYFHTLATQRGWRFFVMYGQTEAAPRISYVPPERLGEKIGSIGIPIPGGALAIDPQNGELLYRGRNVMMGYADGRADLAKGDELGGSLRTGDLGRQDEDGYFFITGRLKRFVKLAGNRIGLDEVEDQLERHLRCPVAACGGDENLRVLIEAAGDRPLAAARAYLQEQLSLHPSLFQAHCVGRLPRLENGKLDYIRAMEIA